MKRSPILAWAAVALWMALIFIFSTDAFAAPNTGSILGALLNWLIPGISPAQLETIHTLTRKLGHLTEYFILALLLGNAWKAQWPHQSRARRCVSILIAATLYAISDEWHQSFVPSRQASAVDVAIDACGAIGAALRRYWRDHD